MGIANPLEQGTGITNPLKLVGIANPLEQIIVTKRKIKKNEKV